MGINATNCNMIMTLKLLLWVKKYKFFNKISNEKYIAIAYDLLKNFYQEGKTSFHF